MNIIKHIKIIYLIIEVAIVLSSCVGVIEVNPTVVQKLAYDGIENCFITKLCDLDNLVFQVADVTVTKKEIDECISEELVQYEKLIEITDRNIVQKGDYISISYVSTCEGKIIDKNENRPLKVGAGNFDEQIEKQLIGVVKNKKFTVVNAIPDNIDDKSLAGKKEKIEIVVKKISRLKKPNITDEWIKEKYGYNTVREFYDTLISEYKEEKQAVAELNAKEKLIKSAIEFCNYKLDDNVILKCAEELYYQEKTAAMGYGTDIESYISAVYGMDIDSFYQYCYDNAETKIKKTLFVGAVSAKYGIEVDENSMEECIRQHDLTKEDISKEDYVLYEYEVLEVLVIDYIVDFCSVPTN